MIAVCPMPYSTTLQRWAVRDELVWAYNPDCQAEGQRLSPGAIAFKPQETVQLPEPRVEPEKEPRRRIGFMPDCEAER